MRNDEEINPNYEKIAKEFYDILKKLVKQIDNSKALETVDFELLGENVNIAINSMERNRKHFI